VLLLLMLLVWLKLLLLLLLLQLLQGLPVLQRLHASKHRSCRHPCHQHRLLHGCRQCAAAAASSSGPRARRHRPPLHRLLLLLLAAAGSAVAAVAGRFASNKLLVVAGLSGIVFVIRVPLALPRPAPATTTTTAVCWYRCCCCCASIQGFVVHLQECALQLLCVVAACGSLVQHRAAASSQQAGQHCCHALWALAAKGCRDCCCQRGLKVRRS
jgi:hypothetical protein